MYGSVIAWVYHSLILFLFLIVLQILLHQTFILHICKQLLWSKLVKQKENKQANNPTLPLVLDYTRIVEA